MRKNKTYEFDGVTLKIGEIYKDKNGYSWKIERLGPKLVWYVSVEFPEDVPHYSAHWHFVENCLKHGCYTTPGNIENIKKRIQNK